VRSAVRLVVHFDGENGFDSSAHLLREDAEAISALFFEAVRRAMPGPHQAEAP
jgi:hypothetical protein